MSELSVTIEIGASPERVWAVVCDVERWPEWTPSVRSVKRLDSGPLAIGSSARIHQPKLPPATWTVTKLEAGRGFDWVTRSPGLAVTGRHWIEPLGAGSRATVSIVLSGVLARLVTWLARATNPQYLELEAAGLKRRSESSAP